MLSAESKRFCESSVQPFSEYLLSYQDHRSPHTTSDPLPIKGERDTGLLALTKEGRRLWEVVLGWKESWLLVEFQLSSASTWEYLYLRISGSALPLMQNNTFFLGGGSKESTKLEDG